jgi:branched-chain amino acid transport system ATP-binding protein
MLTLNSVVSGYGGSAVLQGVTLDVRSGEIVAVLGSNGAGKSTLLRTISGLVRCGAGSITFLDGHDITASRPDRIVRLGLSHCPEGRHIFKRLAVADNLRAGGALLKGPALRSAMDVAYRMFPRLAERSSQLGGSLSGGEQQMLAIARALMNSPRMLLLDEPSLGLAPIIVEDVFKTIRSIAAAGTTVLLVEQNVNSTLKFVDRVYVLERGMIAAEGSPDEIRKSKALTSAYLGA